MYVCARMFHGHFLTFQPVGHNRPPPSYNDAKQILLKALEGSQASAYWHCRLLFQVPTHIKNFMMYFLHSEKIIQMPLK